MVSTHRARARALSASPWLLRVRCANDPLISVVSAFSLSDGGWWWPAPRPSPRRLAPPAARSSPRTCPLCPLPRSSASPGPQTPRAYPERRRAAHARPSEIRAERFSGTRSKGGRPRRPPRTETRGARDRRPRRHRRPRWPSRRATTMSPRALPDPSGCSTRGGNWRRCGWITDGLQKIGFSSASRHSPCYVPRGSPSDLRAAPAPGEAPNRPLCCSLLRSGRRSFASRRRSIWRRRGGGRRESRATKI